MKTIPKKTPITVNIEWFDNYGSSCEALPGCTATGKTLEAVKESFAKAVEFHLEGMREEGYDIPEVFQREYEFDYKLSIEALLHHYDGILSRAAISRLSGINERQLGHYIQGIKKPRAKQRERIISGINKLGRELISVQ